MILDASKEQRTTLITLFHSVFGWQQYVKLFQQRNVFTDGKNSSTPTNMAAGFIFLGPCYYGECAPLNRRS